MKVPFKSFSKQLYTEPQFGVLGFVLLKLFYLYKLRNLRLQTCISNIFCVLWSHWRKIFLMLKYGFCKKLLRYKWTSEQWNIFSSLLTGFDSKTSYKIHTLVTILKALLINYRIPLTKIDSGGPDKHSTENLKSKVFATSQFVECVKAYMCKLTEFFFCFWGRRSGSHLFWQECAKVAALHLGLLTWSMYSR